jgi:hypothetical protein
MVQVSDGGPDGNEEWHRLHRAFILENVSAMIAIAPIYPTRPGQWRFKEKIKINFTSSTNRR